MNLTRLRDDTVFLPKRKPETHKGNYGRLLIVGGCVGYTGAPSLCARAAVRAGAGLVYLGVPRTIYDITAVKNDEAMPFPLPADDTGKLAASAARGLVKYLSSCDVCAVGPGMGKSEGTGAVLRFLMESFQKPMVIDADGLNMLAGQMELLRARTAFTVLTPHEGEFLRLGGTLTGDRAADALAFAEKWGCALVLKGHRSVAAFPDGRVFLGTRGNPGMAKGGSGDVLTGILGALLGQLPPEAAVCTGVHLHSLAGDLCAGEKGEYAMTATDLIETLPAATKILIRE